MKVKRKARPQRKWLWVAAVILTIAVSGWLFFNRGEQSTLTDEQQIRKLYYEKYSWTVGKQRGAIGDIDIDGNWAVASTYAVYINTGKPVPAGPGLMIFRKILGRWYAVENPRWLRRLAIDLLPTSLLPEDVKFYFK